MAENLLIVESPTKTKTFGKFLGKNYKIMASFGHVRDLIPKTGAVDPANHFAMKYRIIEKSEKYLDAIVTAAKTAKNLYLATDPDREGEAIAWHLLEILKERKALKKDTKIHRIVFYEITKTAILEALKNPRELSQDLIHAQQARRALDYLVGFELSPLLWKKIRRGLSAGRVQSPALRLIVERQQEIEKFESKEYWSMHALAKTTQDHPKDPANITGKLTVFNNAKISQFSIDSQTRAQTIQKEIMTACQGHLKVLEIKKSQRKKNPSAPFITSTLQQDAARRFGFSAQRTMQIAQQLYEGIDIGNGEGAVGLITYMRTDSTNIAQEALGHLRDYIQTNYGNDYLPSEARIYKSRSKNAQEAHEAIRPTDVMRAPSRLRTALKKDQFQIYELIWRRAVACQMTHAIYDQVAIDLSAGEGNIFRVNGNTLLFPGYLKVYEESREEGQNLDPSDEKTNFLPPLKIGQVLDLVDIKPEQHFTEPPPKYSEASLIKILEEFGIGRPSTYATIPSTLQNREYVVLDQKRFLATEVGIIVNQFLTKYFPQYVDYDFTANLEDQLDAVARGELNWLTVMEAFWQPFNKLIKTIEKTVERKDVTHEILEENCPKCEKPLSIRLGKRGRFIGCTGYPECDYARSIEQSREESLNVALLTVPDRSCPKCTHQLVYKFGKFGKFIGCSQYPNCKFIESISGGSELTNVQCPSCNAGNLVRKKSRFGTFFYSCSTYPECKYAISNPPIPEPCPICGWKILMLKTTKRRGTERVCPQKTCTYAGSVPENPSDQTVSQFPNQEAV